MGGTAAESGERDAGGHGKIELRPAIQLASSGERHTGHGDQKTESRRAIPKLANFDITLSQSSRWQERDKVAIENQPRTMRV